MILSDLQHWLSFSLATIRICRTLFRENSKPGGVRTTIAMHCGCKIFKMAANVEKFRRLYALFFNRYSSFLRFQQQRKMFCRKFG